MRNWTQWKSWINLRLQWRCEYSRTVCSGNYRFRTIRMNNTIRCYPNPSTGIFYFEGKSERRTNIIYCLRYLRKNCRSKVNRQGRDKIWIPRETQRCLFLYADIANQENTIWKDGGDVELYYIRTRSLNCRSIFIIAIDVLSISSLSFGWALCFHWDTVSLISRITASAFCSWWICRWLINLPC